MEYLDYYQNQNITQRYMMQLQLIEYYITIIFMEIGIISQRKKREEEKYALF